jgi:hypothetical protein
MAFDESVKQLLEAVPSAISVLSPVFHDDGSLHDVELTWLNASMGAIVNNQVSPGHRLQQMYPARDLAAWFSVLLSNRYTETIDRQYWNLTDHAGGDIFEINIRWWDDLLLLTATNTVPKKTGSERCSAGRERIEPCPTLPADRVLRSPPRNLADLPHRELP